ncbi:MAG TPA: tRNA dihydrouridine synthase DusB [Nevskiaceae bacterium]|nr:tRNA dihydrouridine synthase DusB [Nevskiaceae bacterium]
MRIGPHLIDPPLILAPMAGVTDRPFRQLCRDLGAGLTVSEMTTADASLWHTEKSRLRRDHAGEPGPISVQIAGYDPAMMAEAARFNVEHGAQIIDLNFGCPAKKVCRVEAGSALMSDPPRIAAICRAVVAAVSVPVTLKTRTGPHPGQRNAVEIARLAEDAGIAAITLHGRTRADHYRGEAEYATCAAVKRAVGIPVIVNGDIQDAASLRRALTESGADAAMIGRAAQGRPWIFRELGAVLRGEPLPAPPSAAERGALLLGHLQALHAFYGEGRGLRVARKHIQWYCEGQPGSEAFWAAVRDLTEASAQREAVARYFAQLAELPLAA